MRKELERIIEQILVDRIKLIGDKDQTYIGYPDKLIKDLAQAILSSGYIKKDSIGLNVLKIKDILNAICQECKQPDDITCHYTCSVLTHAISQAKNEIIKWRRTNPMPKIKVIISGLIIILLIIVAMLLVLLKII